jgi:hypothetical protein
MPDTLLALGQFSFVGLESPARVILETKQRLVVHHLGSGSTVIDSLGTDIEVVSFSGIFTGTNAATRIQLIENIRRQNFPTSLRWDSRTLTVIIREFNLQYITNQWIPYKLSCLVVSARLSATNFADDTSASPSQQVADIVGLLNGAAISPTAVQTSALSSLATLKFDVAPAVALQTVQAMISTISDQLQNLDQDTQTGVSDMSLSIAGQVASFFSVAANASQLAALQLAYNRLSCISVSAILSNQK